MGFNEKWAQPKVCESMCGFDELLVRTAARKFGVHPTALWVVLVIAHLNLTDEQMGAVLCPYVHDNIVSDTYIRKYCMKPVFARTHDVMFPTEDARFRFRDQVFFKCTMIVDGVPIPSRGGNDMYNGKHGMKLFSYQVLVNMDGCPVAWYGPFQGKEHDSDQLAVSEVA